MVHPSEKKLKENIEKLISIYLMELEKFLMHQFQKKGGNWSKVVQLVLDPSHRK